MNKKHKKLLDDIRYWPIRTWHRLWFVRHSIRHTWWHMTKGFCYCETWGLDNKIAAYALPRLKYLRGNCNSTPTQMFELPTQEELAIKAHEIYLKRIENNEDGNAQKDWDDAEFFFQTTHNEAKFDAAHKKWLATMDEMIYAFEWIVNEDWEKEGIITGKTEPIDPNNKLDEMCYRYGEEKPIYDWDKMREVQTRVDNGLKLLGNNFQSLWD